MEKILVVDDNADICQSLTFLFDHAGYKAEVFLDSGDFLKNYQPCSNACLLLDIRMPRIGGLMVLQEIKKLHQELPVIMMTAHGDIRIAVQAMKLGAYDFIMKPFNIEDVIAVIKSALQLASAQLQKPLIHYAGFFAALSPREREIIKRISNGQLNKIIAAELGVSITTVDIYRARILKKMQAASWAELIKIYWRLELESNG